MRTMAPTTTTATTVATTAWLWLRPKMEPKRTLTPAVLSAVLFDVV